MTEAEWLACTDPTPMLDFLRGKASDRKLRLFAVACCRRIQHLLTEPGSAELVAIREKFTDGEIDKTAYRSAIRKARTSEIGGPWGQRAEKVGLANVLATGAAWAAAGEGREGHDYLIRAAADAATEAASAVSEQNAADRLQVQESREQTKLLRDIFGNPFCPVTADPSWLTSTVLQLAEGIYTDRAFDRMPILADALQDAGCENLDVLEHSRSDGPHVRGCWVVDLLLGKE